MLSPILPAWKTVEDVLLECVDERSQFFEGFSDWQSNVLLLIAVHHLFIKSWHFEFRVDELEKLVRKAKTEAWEA